MREVRRSFGDYLALLGAQVGFVPLSLLTLVLTVRLAGPTQYGTYALFLSVVQLFVVLTLNWTYPSIIRFGKEATAHRRTLRTLIGIRSAFLLGAAALAAIGVLAFRVPLAQYLGVPPSAIWLLLLGTCTFSLANELNYLLQVIGSMRWYSLVQAVEKTLLLASLLIIALTGTLLTATLLIGIALAAKLGATAIAMSRAPVRTLFPLRWDSALLKRVLRYSYPLLAAYASGYVIDWLDLVAIRHYQDVAAVGIYQIAYQGMLFLSSGLMVITTLAFPILTVVRLHQRRTSLTTYAYRLTPQVVYGWSIFLMAFAFLSTFCFTLLFGKPFAGAEIPFLLLLIALAFQAIMVLCGAMLYSHDLMPQATMVQILMAIINVVLNILLIPRIGITGAAAATAVAYGFSSVAYARIVQCHIAPLPRSLFLWPALSTFVILGFALLPRMHALSLAVGCFLLSLMLAKRLALFSPDDLRWVRRLGVPHALQGWVWRVYRWMA